MRTGEAGFSSFSDWLVFNWLVLDLRSLYQEYMTTTWLVYQAEDKSMYISVHDFDNLLL